MEWPPRAQKGRLTYVEGPAACSILIVQTIGDLRQNPFNPPGLCLGDVTFRTHITAKALIGTVLRRLSPIISIESISDKVGEGDSAEYEISFVDRETRSPAKVTVG